MVATTEKPKSVLKTNVKIKSHVNLDIDTFLSTFELCPLKIYTRGDYPSQERIEELASSLYINGRVVVLEAVNWFEITEDTTSDRLRALGLDNTPPGKYLINGNTRNLSLEFLRSKLEPEVFTNILCQEIDISESTFGDLYDLQQFFNDETVAHTRLQSIKSLASLIMSLESQGLAAKEVNKIVRQRKGVTATDVGSARKFFVTQEYPTDDRDKCINFVESGFMSFDTALNLLDLLQNEKVTLTVDEAIAKIAESNSSILKDDGLVTRTMVYDLRSDLLKQAKKQDKLAEAQQADLSEGDADVSADEAIVLVEELTPERQKEKLQDAKDTVSFNIEFLKGELSDKGIKEQPAEKKLGYRDSLPTLCKILPEIIDILPIEEIDVYFSIQADLVLQAIKSCESKMDLTKYQRIASKLNKVYNTIV